MGWLNKIFNKSKTTVDNSKKYRSDTLLDAKIPSEMIDINREIDYQKVFPRLKMGLVDNPFTRSPNTELPDDSQKISIIPEAGQLYGIEMGSDFSCCFAEDTGDLFMLLTKSTVLGKSREEVFTIACNNFINEYGEKVEVHSTNWPDVYMVRIDGNSEASTFLMTPFWQQICQSLEVNELNLLIPLQDLVIFWKDLNDDLYKEMIANLQKLIHDQKESRRVSNYQFLWKENQFYETGKVFE